MDNTPLIPSVPLQTPPLPTPIEPTPRKSMVPVIFTLLFLILLSITAIFGYQNWFLQKQISFLQSQPTATPTPSLSPTPTVDPTVNWLTYTNTKYGYSFKYPTNYLIDQNGVNSPTPEKLDFIIAYDSSSKNPQDDPSFALSVLPKKGTLQQKVQEHFNKVSKYIVGSDPNLASYQSNQVVTPLTSTTFLGKPAFSYTIKGSYFADEATEGLSLPAERQYLWFETSTNFVLIRSDKDVQMDQILATLQFNNSVDTSTWKTYNNATYGYQLKYPPTWKDISDPKSQDKEFTLESPKQERIHAVIFDQTNTYQTENDYLKQFPLKGSTYLMFSYVECDGPGCPYGKLELNTFKQILTTFKSL